MPKVTYIEYNGTARLVVVPVGLSVGDWVDAGRGAAFDPASEAEAFLEFVAGRLSDPSHAMTVCRMEQATYRASGKPNSRSPAVET